MYYIEEVEREYAHYADAACGNPLYGTIVDLDYDSCVGTYDTKEEAMLAFKDLYPTMKMVGRTFHRTDYELWTGNWVDDEVYDSNEFVLDTANTVLINDDDEDEEEEDEE